MDTSVLHAALTAIRDHPWPPGEPGLQAIGDLRRFVAVKQPIASSLGMLPYSAPELAGWLAANLDKYDTADLDAIAEVTQRWAPPGHVAPGPAPAAEREPQMPPRPRATAGQRRPRQQNRPRTA
jgi:hypothetical protein